MKFCSLIIIIIIIIMSITKLWKVSTAIDSKLWPSFSSCLPLLLLIYTYTLNIGFENSWDQKLRSTRMMRVAEVRSICGWEIVYVGCKTYIAMTERESSNVKYSVSYMTGTVVVVVNVNCPHSFAQCISVNSQFVVRVLCVSICRWNVKNSS